MPRLTLHALLLLAAIAAALGWPRPMVSAASSPLPQVRLTKTVALTLPGDSDSNAPVFWDLVDGISVLHVMTSSQRPSISTGSSLWDLGAPEPIECTRDNHGGRWMEAAVLQDIDGVLYGYYHEEPSDICGGTDKTAPRIGAARSHDRGRSWEDLGVVLQAPPGTEQCNTPNKYFVGGVGDFSVILDRRGIDVYFFYSAYGSDSAHQGVAVARMQWADRDAPVGHVDIWDAGVWRPATVSASRALPQLADADPIYPAARSWHDPAGRVDAFWGPSVHWNTYLEQYVMLLNHATDASWKQEGIYISFSPVLDDPSRWSAPYRIMSSDAWYPQVVGLEPGVGTDKVAGQTARLFIQGRSEHFISFERPR